MGDVKLLNDLVPLLKTYLELSDRDRENQLEIIKELKEAVAAIRDCNVAMKLQIKQLETHHKMFSRNCDIRKEDCNSKFKDINEAVHTIPSLDITAERDKKIESLGKKIDALSTSLDKMAIRVYSVLGAGAFILAFLKWVWPIIQKGIA